MMIIRAMVSGCNLLAVKPSANPFNNVKSEIDFAAITPYQFIHSYHTVRDLPIRKIIIGGSQVSLHLQKLMEELQTEMFETYGMTETCSHIALRRLNGKGATDFFELLPGISIGQDQRNCLVIKAPLLTPSELVTNDVVEIADENHFRWLGRFDHVINTGGIKVFPEQIERKLEPFINRRFFVGALPDAQLNEKVVLIIEGDPLIAEEETKLKYFMEENLSKFEKPKAFLYRDAFDISTSGKILKSKILQNYS
ncbi:MAG: AMP-dependent synthetase [Bacteroidetes bacterium]|nr:AMP-dependent synthetase [Bacteroidota bacterium]